MIKVANHFRNIAKVVGVAAVVACLLFLLPAATSQTATKVGIVNFKRCVEISKLGKQEQARFDEVKKQLEGTIDAKEKEVNDLSPKFAPEYLDTLSPEAELELKNRYKNLSQELSQLQNQYYSMLNQTNYQIVQQLSDSVSKAAKKIAQDKGLDLALNEEVCFYHLPALDISNEVVLEMDAQFQKEQSKP